MVPTWSPPVSVSPKEQKLLKLVSGHRKLFGFLRLHRHELFDDAFQSELASMYRDTGAGSPPQPPAFMCMVLLLQGYLGVSDREAVQVSATDARWQLVLGTLGSFEPSFSQGGLQQFRERLIANDLDKRLLERSVELARKTREFDWKKLPKSLRLGVDSRPLAGAGRVEDTFNLLGHAARKIAECAASLTGLSTTEICARAHAPVLLAPSIKAGLDIDWSDDTQKEAALNDLVVQVSSLSNWVGCTLGGDGLEGPITKYIEALQLVQAQNLEENGHRVRLAVGVAPDRRVSVEDADMRHGRKSKSRAFNGYKEHVVVDLDRRLVIAAVATPGNVHDSAAAPLLWEQLQEQNIEIAELYGDLAYAGTTMNDDVERLGGVVMSKPWPAAHPLGLFSKTDFEIDIRARLITCPGGQRKPIVLGDAVVFDVDKCRRCVFDSQCRQPTAKSGRTVQIALDEERQVRLRRLAQSKDGRGRLRARTTVEHRLAHIGAKKGPRARYRGTAKNTFDLRRATAITNLEVAMQVGLAA
jgi:hypothetical protein